MRSARVPTATMKIFKTFTPVSPSTKATQAVMNHGFTQGEPPHPARLDAQANYKMAIQVLNYRERY